MLTLVTTDSLHAAGLTSPGRVREHNEDALLCSCALGLWAIADGMGGHQCGEVASTLALAALEQAIGRGETLEQAVGKANEAVLAATTQHDMGTTLVAVHFQGADFQLAWAGDSRAYRITTGDITPLTRDHSWVQAMIDAGELDPSTAHHHRLQNVILKCLGRDEALEAGILKGTLQAGELLLLCSDGLTRELSDVQIHALCRSTDTLERLVEQLIEHANAQGGRDNVSCIVIARTTPPAEVPSPGRRLLDKLLKPLKP
ncbi:serine/threonine-protein phosphatase [Stutzerimonas urumqiensis]|uniref:PP2C family protein-serine/threonine phosphatase n=1 Tax=Stutzerimonas urumqiensis TaxID=638269 RepID=UPI003BA9F1B4